MANTTLSLRVDNTKIISGISKGVNKALENPIKYVAFNSNELHVFWEEDKNTILKTSNSDTNQDGKLPKIHQKKSIFHAMWLRDNDQSPVSRHPSNGHYPFAVGQRNFNILDVPEDLYITNAKVVFNVKDKDFPKQAVEVIFSGDKGHYTFKSTYDTVWLRKHDYCNNFSSQRSLKGHVTIGALPFSSSWNNKENNDEVLRDMHWYTDSQIQLWDKQFFQDISNELKPSQMNSNNTPFRHGLKFHQYDILVSLNESWKKDYLSTANGGGYPNANCSLFRQERARKFKPLMDFLEDFVRYGFMLVEGVPVKDGAILKLPALFDGYVLSLIHI